MCPICRPAIAGKTAPSCLLRVGIEICQVLLSAKKSSAIASSRAWQAGPTVVKLHCGELGFAEALFRGWSLEATCSSFLILHVLCQTTLKKDQCTSSRTRNLIGIVHMNGFRLVFGISHSRFFLSHSMQLLFHLLFTFRYFSTDILRSSPYFCVRRVCGIVRLFRTLDVGTALHLAFSSFLEALMQLRQKYFVAYSVIYHFSLGHYIFEFSK